MRAPWESPDERSRNSRDKGKALPLHVDFLNLPRQWRLNIDHRTILAPCSASLQRLRMHIASCVRDQMKALGLPPAMTSNHDAHWKAMGRLFRRKENPPKMHIPTLLSQGMLSPSLPHHVLAITLLGHLVQAETRLRHLLCVDSPTTHHMLSTDPCAARWPDEGFFSSRYSAGDSQGRGAFHVRRKWMWGPLLRMYAQGRELETSGKRTQAEAVYRDLVARAESSPEAARAILRLMDIWCERALADTNAPNGAATKWTVNGGMPAEYWRMSRLLARHWPDVGDHALSRQRSWLTASPRVYPWERQQWEAKLVAEVPGSNSAAKIRWGWAQAMERKGDIAGALREAKALVQDAPRSQVAPEAAYWAGRWSIEEQRTRAETNACFRAVLRNAPLSYYAFRASAFLGLPVGTLNDLHSLPPTAAPPRWDWLPSLPLIHLPWGGPKKEAQPGDAPSKPPQDNGGSIGNSKKGRRSRFTVDQLEPSMGSRGPVTPLPVGSPLVRALYRQREYKAAFQQWQKDMAHHTQPPSLGERISDGLLRLGAGDYIGALGSLDALEGHAFTWAERCLLATVVGHRAFAEALYPLVAWPRIKKWSTKRGLNPLLTMAVVRKESCHEADIESPVGAKGLMQVMPETAAWCAATMGLQSYALTNADHNVEMGTWYFSWMLRHLHENNPLLTLASYNAGPSNVETWVNRSPRLSAHAARRLSSFEGGSISDSGSSLSSSPRPSPGAGSAASGAAGAGASGNGRAAAGAAGAPQQAQIDWDLFVETIPYRETKDYVKGVFGHYWNYCNLYLRGLRRAVDNETRYGGFRDQALEAAEDTKSRLTDASRTALQRVRTLPSALSSSATSPLGSRTGKPTPSKPSPSSLPPPPSPQQQQQQQPAFARMGNLTTGLGAGSNGTNGNGNGNGNGNNVSTALSNASSNSTTTSSNSSSSSSSNGNGNGGGSQQVASAPPDPIIHTVAPGESMMAIAAKYGVGASQIYRCNASIRSADVLYVGQRLRIPFVREASGNDIGGLDGAWGHGGSDGSGANGNGNGWKMGVLANSGKGKDEGDQNNGMANGRGPLAAPLTYIVRPGDTLDAVSALHGTDIPTVKRLNPGVDAMCLPVGAVLVVRPS